MSWLWRRRRDQDLAEEVDTHLALAEEELRRQGMSDQDARDAARRAFGGVLKTRQIYREQARGHWLESLIEDARVGLRVLIRDRAFAVTAILVLGLGIGVNNMQFTIIYAHTMRGLPIDGAGRVLIASLVDERGVDRNLSYAEYRDLASGADRLDDVAAFGAIASVSLGDEGRAPDRSLAVYTTANALAALRVTPLIGRGFMPDEERPGAARVVILGGEAWRARYDNDPSIVGRSVLINGQPATVVGVLRERSGFPSTAQVMMPVGQAPAFAPERRDARTLRAFGRVRDGVSVEQAKAQLETLLSQAIAGSGESARGLLPSVAPISDRFSGRATDPTWMAFLAAGFLVVAVASANAANLMLARGVRRRREIAIRGSLGATRARVIVQLLVESVVLASLAGLVGIAVSIAGAQLFQATIPANAMPYWFHYSMDATVVAALLAVSWGTVLVFGVAPALQASRTDVARVLKDGGWSASGRRGGRRLTIGFMAAQLGLSVVLLSYVVISLLDRGAQVPSDAVLSTTDLITAAVSLPADRYSTPQQRANFFSALDERVRAIAGVDAAAITSSLPRAGAAEQRLELAPGEPRERLPPVWTVAVGASYFDTLRLPLPRGRELDGGGTAAAASDAIVNQRFVEMFMRDGEVLGRAVSLVSANPRDETRRTATIVGVAPDIRHRSGAPDPVVYLPLAASPPASAAVILRTGVDTAAMTRQLRDAVLALDSTLPVYQVMTMRQVIRDAEWNGRVSAGLVTVLALIVMLLSTVGLYAVTAHAVSQRSKEIGIRMAVGARPAQIQRMVLHGAALQVMLGLIFGVFCTLAWDGVFFSGRVDIRFAAPGVLGPVAAMLAAVTLAAALLPMRRAARLDAVSMLRHD